MDTSKISHPGIVRHLRDLARQQDIPSQLEVLNLASHFSKGSEG